MSAIEKPNGLDYNVELVRKDFPVLERTVHGKPLVYFDTAASAQRPLAVIEAVDDFYRNHNANVHRGVHLLSQEATDLYEAARRDLAKFINAQSDREIVFTRGTTESINLVAQSFLRSSAQSSNRVITYAAGMDFLEQPVGIVRIEARCTGNVFN